MNRNLFIRLAFAAHRVADALPDEELKQEIKESANAILADLILFVEKEGVFAEKRKAVVPQLIRQIDILAVYLDRAKQKGWVQAENFSILEVEYERIKDFLLVFESIQEVPQEEQKATSVQQKKELIRAPKTEVSSQPVKKEETVSPEKRIEVKGDLTERQRKIIEFLKRKETAQVWELQKVLPQVTKRTLRRDLDSLLQLNLVQRKGEWNSVVYELKQKETVA